MAESLQRDGVTIVSLVTTMLTRLLDAGAAIERPRAMLVGGGPVPDEVLAEALGLGATVVQTYGLTEACSQVTTLSPSEAERKRGSAGRPLLTTHVRIDDGEILVQGPTVAPGAADQDGWLHTGDCGRIDAEGFLWVEGRRDDVIVTGGENVAPEEVEEVLAAHPDVVEAAVVGRPDPDWQNAVVAVVVARDGGMPEPEELRSWCASRLAAVQGPEELRDHRRAAPDGLGQAAARRAALASPAHGRSRERRGNLLRRRRGPLGPRGQDRRDPRLRLPGARPRAQPEGLRRGRGRRAAAGLLQPRGRRGGRASRCSTSPTPPAGATW